MPACLFGNLRPHSSSTDPRLKLVQSLYRKAEQGDVRAYEAWKSITDELESESLARDGAGGAEAWEQITPEQRRWLLELLSEREGDGVAQEMPAE